AGIRFPCPEELRSDPLYGSCQRTVVHHLRVRRRRRSSRRFRAILLRRRIMARYPAKGDPHRCPAHPGELLREVIPATGKRKAEIAALLGISRQHLYDILNERKPVSAAVAVRLGKLFGDGGGVWVRMQGAYD